MLHKSRVLCVIACLALVLMAGCAQTQPTPDPNGDGPADPPASHLPGEKVAEVPEGPQEKDGQLILEGMEEPFTFHRFHAEKLGMVTYLPHDLVTEPVTSEEGDLVMIWAAFAGSRNVDAYLSLMLYPEEASPESILQERLDGLEQAGFTVEDMVRPDEEHTYIWAHEAYTWHGNEDGQAYSGIVAVGNHGERLLVVEIRIPSELAEGFYPRAEAVMEAMMWYGF